MAEAIEIAKQLGPDSVELYYAFLDELPSGEWNFVPSLTSGHPADALPKLIRNSTTGKFLTPDGRWTDDPLKARTIQSVREALALIEQLMLRDVELYSPKAD